MISVELPEQFTPLLVIEAPTGVVYSTQAGGTACAHPEAEGFLVPLDYFDTAPLEKVYRDRWDNNVPECDERVTVALAAARDGRLEPIGLALDVERYAWWGEAWLPIVCTYGRGWLTWPNSD